MAAVNKAAATAAGQQGGGYGGGQQGGGYGGGQQGGGYGGGQQGGGYGGGQQGGGYGGGQQGGGYGGYGAQRLRLRQRLRQPGASGEHGAAPPAQPGRSAGLKRRSQRPIKASASTVRMATTPSRSSQSNPNQRAA